MITTREDYIKYVEVYLANLFGDNFIRYSEDDDFIKIVFKPDVLYGNRDIYKLIQYFNMDIKLPRVESGGYNTLSNEDEKTYILNKVKNER